MGLESFCTLCPELVIISVLLLSVVLPVLLPYHYHEFLLQVEESTKSY